MQTQISKYNNLLDQAMSGNIIESEINGHLGLEIEDPEADVFRNIDERINCKIAAGMKKAIHLIVERFDDLFQQKLKMLAQSEVDYRIREIRELAIESIQR